MEKEKRRSINVVIPMSEIEKLTEICHALGVDRTDLIRLIIDYLHHKLITWDSFNLDIEELASKYNVGPGVLTDIFDVY